MEKHPDYWIEDFDPTFSSTLSNTHYQSLVSPRDSVHTSQKAQYDLSNK